MDPKAKLKSVLKEPPVRGKPTVATILREHKLVEARDAVERQELDCLMQGGLSPENYHYWLERRKEEEERLCREVMEQRKSDARLTSEKIAERSRQKLEENRIKAQQFKEEEEKLKLELDEKKEKTLNCNRSRVDQIMLNEIMTHVAVVNKQKEKHMTAQTVKDETFQKIEEGKKAKEKEMEERSDRIKRIQAQSLVSHKIRQIYSPYNEVKGCQMSDSEAQFRIYLQQCEEAARIITTRNRIRTEKSAHREKIEEAKQKIAAYHDLVKERKKYKL